MGGFVGGIGDLKGSGGATGGWRRLEGVRGGDYGGLGGCEVLTPPLGAPQAACHPRQRQSDDPTG